MTQKILWQPHKGPQTEALVQTAHEILYGGARGGGKTESGLAWLIEPQYLNNPSYRALVVRRNYDDLRDFIDRAKVFWYTLGVKVRGNPAEFIFPSGARIRTGHLADSDAYMKYLGHEYHKMLIEELTLIPYEEDYLRLISSCRSSNKDLPAQLFSTTNPGGPGHAWVKSRFVDVSRNKEYKDPITGRTRIFIPSKITDNPTLIKNDPTYYESLKGLPDELRRAWLDGDWDIFAGQFFRKWRIEHHVVEPFEIPSGWHRYRAIDYGFANYFCCLWISVDFEGNAYVYKEHYEKQRELNYHIKRILAISGDEEYNATVGDPSMWIRNPQNTNRSDITAPTHMSIADIMLFGGVNVMRANNDRINGWNNIREYLDWNDEDKRKPKLKVFSNCANLIRTFPMMVHDDKRPEDLDTTGEDHALDSLRYGLLYLGKPTEVRLKPWLERELEKLKASDSEFEGIRN